MPAAEPPETIAGEALAGATDTGGEKGKDVTSPIRISDARKTVRPPGPADEHGVISTSNLISRIRYGDSGSETTVRVDFFRSGRP